MRNVEFDGRGESVRVDILWRLENYAWRAFNDGERLSHLSIDTIRTVCWWPMPPKP
jgi:hypothetical protein